MLVALLVEVLFVSEAFPPVTGTKVPKSNVLPLLFVASFWFSACCAVIAFCAFVAFSEAPSACAALSGLCTCAPIMALSDRAFKASCAETACGSAKRNTKMPATASREEPVKSAKEEWRKLVSFASLEPNDFNGLLNANASP